MHVSLREISDQVIVLTGATSGMELEEEGAPISVTLIKPASVNTMLTEHAKNYLDVRPRLPPPVYAPEAVAKAILHAARYPTRDMYVGGGAKLLGMGEHYMPRLLDRGMVWLMFRLQRTNKPPYPESRHNLHSPGADMKERSPTDAHVFEHSRYTEAIMRPKLTNAVLLVAGLAAMSIWKFRKISPTKRPSGSSRTNQ
jgi:hypothetical protein